MNTQMAKLLFETNNQVEMLVENTPAGKALYIEGIFAQAEVKNGNKRLACSQHQQCYKGRNNSRKKQWNKECKRTGNTSTN